MSRHTWLVAVCALVAHLAPASGVVFAQGGATSSITGSVHDSSGGVLPGADVVVKNVATTAESRTVSSEQGTFTIPALNAGTITVTVTLMGFKTVVLENVVLNAGVPTAVKAMLEIGGLEETQEVLTEPTRHRTAGPNRGSAAAGAQRGEGRIDRPAGPVHAPERPVRRQRVPRAEGQCLARGVIRGAHRLRRDGDPRHRDVGRFRGTPLDRRVLDRHPCGIGLELQQQLEAGLTGGEV